MSTTLRTTAKRLLAVARAIDPQPEAHDRCPRCEGALAEPDFDQLLAVADLTGEQLHEAYGSLSGGMGPPPPPAHSRARLMWCPACARLVPAGAFPAEWQRIIHSGQTRPEDAPHELLRNKRDLALVHVVKLSTGHTETEERWLRANGHRSWLNYYDGDGKDSPYRHVTDYWVFLHDEALAEPVLELAVRYGWWPAVDAEAPAGPGPAPAGSSYSDILVDDGGPPRFGEDEPSEQA
jgi:hypothetical protein